MLSSIPRQDHETHIARDRRRWPVDLRGFAMAAFPFVMESRLLQHTFRGLLNVHSRYGLLTRRSPKATVSQGFSGFVTATTA